MAVSQETSSFIGPHEGRELEMLRAGTKPLCLFVEPVPADAEYFPEHQFDELVAAGKAVKQAKMTTFENAAGETMTLRRIYYALPSEAWRINSIILVHQVYDSLPGWRPDLERIIGLLLGYDIRDVERFLDFHGFSGERPSPPEPSRILDK